MYQLCILAILVQVTAAFVAPANASPTMKNAAAAGLRKTATTSTRTSATADDAVTAWVKEAGHGSVVKSQPLGSSGWASFCRVEVSDPNTPDFFVKSSDRSAEEMFEGEALGLQAMYECSKGDDGLRIPKVFHCGDFSSGSFLVMEYLNLAGRSDDEALGRAMARMHLTKPSEAAGNPTKAFGFAVDNTIGGTPQPNGWTAANAGTDEWVVFFRDKRIGHQLNLAGDSYCSNLWDEKIAPRLGGLFKDCDVKPSILHGDLWSGNIGSANGKPTIYDPAVYWGHHEAEWGVSSGMS